MHQRFKGRHHDERRQQIRMRQLSRMQQARRLPRIADTPKQSPIIAARALHHAWLPDVRNDDQRLSADVGKCTRSAIRAYRQPRRIS